MKAVLVFAALAVGLAAAAWAEGNAPHAYHLPPEKLAQAVALSRIRLGLHFGEELWGAGFLWLLLATGGAFRLGAWMMRLSPRPWIQSALYAAALGVAVFLAVDLPAGVIAHAFSLHYGISVEGWIAWLADMAKMFGLALLVQTPLLMLAFALMRWRWSARRYWFWFSCVTAPLLLLGVFLLPPLIEPLFNTYEPLAASRPALAMQLQRVVARTGASIPPERMFLMKASEKSNGLNAYVSGLGSSKRIVVWDTTADRMPIDEIQFIFSHESGHYVLHHIAKGLVLASVGTFAMFWATARLAAMLVGRFGASWKTQTVAHLPGLAVLLLALALLQIATEPIQSTIFRHFEHEADVYGQEAIHGLVADPQQTAVRAFNHLGEAYLDDPNPNPWVEFWSYDHPSTQRRATFAAHYDPWAAGQQPRFFPK